MQRKCAVFQYYLDFRMLNSVSGMPFDDDDDDLRDPSVNNK